MPLVPSDDYIWILLFQCQQELLLFSAFWIIIGAFDDLLVDLIWAARAVLRWITRYRRRPPMRATDLPRPKAPGLLAVFVPAWDEAQVISEMLTRCGESWATPGADYRIFVGCYPNDPATIDRVFNASRLNPLIEIVICERPGPTTKADCLNQLWNALLLFEKRSSQRAKAIILHDAEDAVHPFELRAFDYLVERASAVQLPVIPQTVPGSPWISGHYCDEFAEAHAKSLVVREAIGAALPLAGVGCAFERSQLDRIAQSKNGLPFDELSLTEDYELGLAIGRSGGRTIMARLRDEGGGIVATHAFFPASLGASVRQKSRWIIGISLAGWDRLGWSGGVAETWMRLRDRKTLIAAIVLLAAYLSALMGGLLLLAEIGGFFRQPGWTPTLHWMLGATSVVLLWRAFVRACFVGQAYGWRQALMSVPRSLVANIIAMLAARRALFTYIRHLLGGNLFWDKTTHHYVPLQLAGRPAVHG